MKDQVWCPWFTKCGYEVPRMILLWAYLYTYSLQKCVIFSSPLEHQCTLPNNAATVGNTFGTPIVEHFSLPSSHFFGCLQYPEIFITLRQNLFLERARSHLEPN